MKRTSLFHVEDEKKDLMRRMSFSCKGSKGRLITQISSFHVEDENQNLMRRISFHVKDQREDLSRK